MGPYLKLDMPVCFETSHMVVASLLDDVNMSIFSIYLVKNMHDGQMDSA